MPSPTPPIHWTAHYLAKQELDTIHDLARTSAGTVNAYRLVLGRCLLALHRTGRYEEFGCSSAIHYAVRVLGMDKRVARTARWIADRLEELPLLTGAAEHGRIDWSKLRIIVGKATDQTEAFWLELAQSHNCDQLARLAAQTPHGGIPGDLEDEPAEAGESELRLILNPTARRVVEHALISLSQEFERPVSLAEALEYLGAERLARRPVDQNALERARKEARKDLEAEERVYSAEVREARELAADMGLIEGEQRASECEGGHTCVHPPEGEDLWRALVAAQEQPCPGASSNLVSRAEPHWTNPDARTPTAAQSRQLKRRDCYRCMTPHCPNTIWLETHHIAFYSEGGLTLPGNLVVLCSKCHGLVHGGYLKITGTAPDNLTFEDHRGRPLAHCIGTEIAGWLDSWLGWKTDQSRLFRFYAGELDQLVPDP